MSRNHLLLGISAAALAAGAAHAQTSTNTGSSTCGTGGTGNVCSIDNNVSGNDNNQAAIRINSGSNNQARITQRGDRNRSGIEIDGSNNSVTHNQFGDDLFSLTDIDGNRNTSLIQQGDDENSATVVQTGNDNSSTVSQGFAFASVLESGAGEENVARVVQTGSNLTSAVFQGFAANLVGNTEAGNNNASVTQTGSGSSSTINQIGRGDTAIVNLGGGGVDADNNLATGTAANTSFIQQQNDSAVAGSTVLAGNVANVAITSANQATVLGNSSSVRQNGTGNQARVSILGGGSGVTTAGATGVGGEAIGAGRSQGNTSDIRQQGTNHFARVSSGGLNGSGNSTTIFQGLENFARDDAPVGGTHSATVFQSGTLDTVRIQQRDSFGNNTVAVSGRQTGSVANVATIGLNSNVTVFQDGTNNARVSTGAGGGNNFVLVDQTDAGDLPGTPDNIFTGGGTGNVAALNTASISQAGVTNDAIVTQNAVAANAQVFQQLGSRNNVADIDQGGAFGRGGAGDFTTFTTVGGGARPAASAQGQTRSDARTLFARVEQSGSFSGAEVRQDGQNNSLTVTQTGTGTVATLATRNLAQVSQVNRFNVSSVTQNGSRLQATVDQRGTGTAALRNNVTVEQTGDRHRAFARQTENVGPSTANGVAAGPAGADFARAAGAQSAEIRIIQTGAQATGTTTGGNLARVEQDGRGQFARILQNGRDNTAGISQTATATNSVAVIEQQGNNNQFFITQTQAGQYFLVRQNGGSNVASSQTSGPGNTPGGQFGGNGSSDATANPFQP